MRKKLDLEPGRKYRGYALLNEYGEFEFTPENTGSRSGSIKTLKETERYIISTSKKKVFIHIRLERVGGFKLIKKFLETSTEVVTELRNYEI